MYLCYDAYICRLATHPMLEHNNDCIILIVYISLVDDFIEELSVLIHTFMNICILDNCKFMSDFRTFRHSSISQFARLAIQGLQEYKIFDCVQGFHVFSNSQTNYSSDRLLAIALITILLY